MWLQAWFRPEYWLDESFASIFEKTDAASRKSVNLAFELNGKSANRPHSSDFAQVSNNNPNNYGCKIKRATGYSVSKVQRAAKFLSLQEQK